MLNEKKKCERERSRRATSEEIDQVGCQIENHKRKRQRERRKKRIHLLQLFLKMDDEGNDDRHFHMPPAMMLTFIANRTSLFNKNRVKNERQAIHSCIWIRTILLKCMKPHLTNDLTT
jgi:hypothetical protein